MAKPLVALGPISHIGIVVEDCEKSAEWYERVFGLGPFSTREFAGNRVHVYEVYLDTAKFTGGTTIQLLEMTPLVEA